MSRTLVIQLARLGDVIQTTPLLAELTQQEPPGSVDAVVLQANRFVLDGLPLGRLYAVSKRSTEVGAINEQLIAGLRERRAPQEAHEIWRELDLPHYQRVINCCYSPLACWLAARITSEDFAGGVITEQGEMLYRHDAHIYFAAQDYFRHQNWFNLVDLWRTTAPVVRPPATGARPHIPLARDVPIQISAGTIVALNPGASDSQRRWPPGDFAKLVRELTAHGLIPVLLGAPADREICQAVQKCCSVPVESFCDLSVPEMATFLSQAALLVSNDTGAVHIAAAAGCKVLGLFGGSAYFAETAPWGEGHLVLQGELGSPGVALSPEAVLAAVLNRLGLADGEALQHELTRQGVTGWETFFLPTDSDPLGGISYRALHQTQASIEDTFTRILRHLFAQVFCAHDGNNPTLAPLGFNPPAAPFRFAKVGHAPVLRQALAPFLAALEQLADRLARCQILCAVPEASAVGEMNRLVDSVVKDTDALKASAELQPAVKPVIHFLDWKCRMMAPLPPRETFAFQEREYRRAVQHVVPGRCQPFVAACR